MNQEYFTLWILDEILGLPRDVIRWEIWDCIDYRSVLNDDIHASLDWICNNHEFSIGEIWAHKNVHRFKNYIDVSAENMYSKRNIEAVNWILTFLITLIKKSGHCWFWESHHAFCCSIYHVIIICCENGDIDTIKKIPCEELDKMVRVIVDSDDVNEHPDIPLYRSWCKGQKALSVYLWNNKCGCGYLGYNEENDTLFSSIR